ncbi:MAG: bifunctional acetate--CoA ligase family protein/GNAT family N-acetyltransferase [Candidatus Acidiferrales bacterium]|jgi:acetyltransferase
MTTVTTTSSFDIAPRPSLDSFFSPQTVALVGATDREGSVGRTVLHNLLRSPFTGQIFAVNPKRTEIMGVRSYPDLRALPGPMDLVVVVTPAGSVPAVVRECVDAGARSCIVISAGFKEHGAQGAQLERQIQMELRRGSMRLVGPNCLGMMNPWIGLDATFAQAMARPGNVAFLSQSGALLTAVLDWSLREQVGFSGIVSTGSMLDVGWGDLISFFGDDPQTQSILMYMESVGDARSFLSAAREVALNKPIIVIKAGRTAAASKAASSHTGALTGSDEVFEAAVRRCGVLRVQNISDLFYMAEVLGKQPRPNGPHLTVLTNAGGPGVLATDALIANGGELTALSEETMKSLDSFLPAPWSHGNPVDVLGDADPERYAHALEVAMADPSSDGLLVILTPQGMTDPASVADRLKIYAKGSGKPVLASWMGADEVAKGEAILNEAGIPTFSYPDTAARAFDYMWRYSYNLRSLYEIPAIADSPLDAEVRSRQANQLLDRVLSRGRTLLTEAESKELLAIYDIPTVPTRVAQSADEAARVAGELGYPSVLKLFSETITHKTDVGGVKLNLADASAVRQAYQAIESSVTQKAGKNAFQGVTVQPMVRLEGYELILGSSVDTVFGPVMLFGSGGQLVEVYRDRALALPPLNTTLAQRMMEQTRVYKALLGVRGRAAVDLVALERVLVRFSQMIVELRRVSEVDINPLVASPKGIMALDARVVLADPKTKEEDLPRPAIRPYPAQYISRWQTKNGTDVLIRPIRPEDEPLMVKFHGTLSEQTVYLRFFHMANLSARIAHGRLLRKCYIDYDREMALVVEHVGPSGEPAIIGVGRLTRMHAPRSAEIAILITDDFQRQGLGGELIRRLLDIARIEKLGRIVAHILPENAVTRAFSDRFGFTVEPAGDQNHLRAVKNLDL